MNQHNRMFFGVAHYHSAVTARLGGQSNLRCTYVSRTVRHASVAGASEVIAVKHTGEAQVKFIATLTLA